MQVGLAAGGAARRPSKQALVTRLLAIREAHFAPLLEKLQGDHRLYATGLTTFIVRWRFEGQAIELRCNLSDKPAPALRPQDWPELNGSISIYTVGTLGPEWWSPWSGQWTIGQEL